MSKNILIVDDYACIRSQLRSVVEEAGLNVCGEKPGTAGKLLSEHFS
jgi:hypothetical protein